MTKKDRKIQNSKPQKLAKSVNKASVSSGNGQKAKAANPLDGARFRWLNESLYTEPSGKSFDLFQKDPGLFNAYHSGFRSQTLSWPISPVQECCAYISEKLSPGSVIGDFGCGDADIAKTIGSQMKVHSFDLVSTNELVTACNIAKVSLVDESLDMAVFSLSLMGTDWPKFIAEAQRCLKLKGILYIAEVQSRVVDFTIFRASFLPNFEVVKSENVKEKYFVKLILRKVSHKPVNLVSTLLKPCLYKRR